VAYRTLGNNPNYDATAVLSWTTIGWEHVRTKADGSFEATVLPGEGHLLVKGPTRDYLLERIDAGQLSRGRPGGVPQYVHAAMRVDLKTGETPAEVKLSLRRGVTLCARVLDPAGKPVKQAVLYSHLYLHDHGDDPLYFPSPPLALPIRDGELVLPGCDPKATVTAFLLDGTNRHGAVVKLAPGKESTATIRLAPCGTARRRVVDDKGKALAGFDSGLNLPLDAKGYSVLSDLPSHPLPGAAGRSGKDGVVNVALIPGATYRYSEKGGYHTGDTREFVAESGKVHQLSDLVIKRRRE
jgi:hypothetical protein